MIRLKSAIERCIKCVFVTEENNRLFCCKYLNYVEEIPDCEYVENGCVDDEY